MSETKDQGLATLLSRLAGQEMLGFRVADGVTAGTGTKVGSGKPPPVMPAR